MAKVQPGRYTAEIEGDFVVFVIGMRFNKLWKVWRWWSVFTAMPKMLAELQRHPELGLMSTRFARSGRTITLIQYWRSFEQLETFARAPEPHFAAWRRFNTEIGASGDVGIYHETFRVHAGDHESIYSNMPVMGLAAAGRSVRVGARTEAARARLEAGTPV
jgi:hypothetical protein